MVWQIIESYSNLNSIILHLVRNELNIVRDIVVTLVVYFWLTYTNIAFFYHEKFVFIDKFGNLREFNRIRND